jgi:hypothetical protein
MRPLEKLEGVLFLSLKDKSWFKPPEQPYPVIRIMTGSRFEYNK